MNDTNTNKADDMNEDDVTLTALPSASFVASGLTANAPTTMPTANPTRFSNSVSSMNCQAIRPRETPMTIWLPISRRRPTSRLDPHESSNSTAPTIQRAASIGFIELARERSGAICFSCSISVGEVSSWFAGSFAFLMTFSNFR